jgi:hypothetical protein
MEFLLLCYNELKMNIKLPLHTGILFNLFDVCYLWPTFGTVLNLPGILCLRASGGFSETLVHVYETSPSHNTEYDRPNHSPLTLITFYDDCVEYTNKGKDKVSPLCFMKAYRGIIATTLLILNLSTSWR